MCIKNRKSICHLCPAVAEPHPQVALSQSLSGFLNVNKRVMDGEQGGSSGLLATGREPKVIEDTAGFR